MIDYLYAAGLKPQLTNYLALITHLIRLKVRKSTQRGWIELIRAVDRLISQTVWIRRRIDFTEKVDSIEANRIYSPISTTFIEKASLLSVRIKSSSINLQIRRL